MRPGKRRELDKANNPIDALIDKVEKLKARIRAKVEHPFRVIKRQFGFAKVILPPYNRTRPIRSLAPMALVDFGIGLPFGCT